MIIYDLEIVKAIPPRDGIFLKDIEYCHGWNDTGNMGISVICAYNYKDGTYRVFCQDNFDDFQDLLDTDRTLVGFNNIKFDNAVLRANGFNVDEAKCYDILREIWIAAGLAPEYSPGSHDGYGLDAICKINLAGRGKNGHGANAAIDWQRGKIGKVIDYCLRDVWLTRLLLNLIEGGQYDLIDPKTRGTLRPRLPGFTSPRS